MGKSITFRAKPEVVGSLACSPLTTNSITVSWANVEGATRYKAEIGGFPAMEQTEIFKVFNNLSPATSYWIIVFSGNQDGLEAVGRQIACTTLTTPPTNIIKTQSAATSLSFQWRQMTGANMYCVELLDDNDDIIRSVDLGDVNIHTFNGLSPDTHYSCKVYAGIEGMGKSLGDTTVRTTPDLPSGLRVLFATSTFLQVAWDASSGATAYQVELFLGEELYSSFIVLEQVTNHTFENLLPFSNYTIVIKVMNDGGTEPTGVSITQRTYPALVLDLDSSSPSPRSIRATWSTSRNTRYCSVYR